VYRGSNAKAVFNAKVAKRKTGTQRKQSGKEGTEKTELKKDKRNRWKKMRRE